MPDTTEVKQLSTFNEVEEEASEAAEVEVDKPVEVEADEAADLGQFDALVVLDALPETAKRSVIGATTPSLEFVFFLCLTPEKHRNVFF